MSDSPTLTAQSSIPLTVAIPALAALFIGGGATIWSLRSDPTASANLDDKRPSRVSRDEEDFRITEPVPLRRKFLPPRPELLPSNDVHSLRRVEENGTKLILIRLVPGGDELVLEAATGKLIETRPAAGNRVETKIFAPPMRLPGLRHVVAPMGVGTTSTVDADRPTSGMR